MRLVSGRYEYLFFLASSARGGYGLLLESLFFRIKGAKKL